MTILQIRNSIKLPKSSIIDRMIYTVESQELTIYFENGSSYFYKKVPKEVVKAFSKAPSVGSFFVKNIKGKFSCKKLESNNEY